MREKATWVSGKSRRDTIQDLQMKYSPATHHGTLLPGGGVGGWGGELRFLWVAKTWI